MRERLLPLFAPAAAACLALMALSPTASAGPPPAARAHTALTSLLCTGEATGTYDPPLTHTTRQTTVAGTEDYDCVGNVLITAGTGTFSVTQDASCTSLNLDVPNHVTYHWNPGTRSSSVSFPHTNVVRANGLVAVTSTGTVTSGLGKGASANRVVVLPEPDLTACSGDGLEDFNGTATLTILGL
ncbi:hypothetical protein ACFCYM_34645 [Streptomyces sp. NPDC056254]|uniref:hypothetical protein n=1 Tax=Streptomyces sp. NPDC056254 TaxID=3345763 RepID=UPI0035D73870